MLKENGRETRKRKTGFVFGDFFIKGVMLFVSGNPKSQTNVLFSVPKCCLLDV